MSTGARHDEASEPTPVVLPLWAAGEPMRTVEEAGLLELLFATSGTGIAFFDREGRYLRVNETLARMNGLPAADHVGRTVRQVLPPTVAEAVEPLLAQVLRGEVQQAVVERQVVMGPQAREFRLDCRGLRGAHGEVLGAASTIVEVTAERSAAAILRALRQSDERFQLVARASNDALWEYDWGDSRGWWSESAGRLFEYSSEQMISDSTWWEERLHPADRDRVIAGVPAAVAEGRDCWSDEYRFLKGDGTWAVVFDRAYIQYGTNGTPIRVIGAMMDVTERRQAEAEREALLVEACRAREEAEAANQAKMQFLAVMSHELRTPLNAIAGYAELLELGVRGPINDAQREDLHRIQRSQRHLLSLINDVLSFARIEAGKVPLMIEEVSLGDALLAVESLVRPQLTARGLSYRLSFADRSLVVRADVEKLQQVLLNLLSNAIKFAPQGGTISLAADARTDFVEVAVMDSGEGVPADKLETIFEPFVQLERGLTRTHDGTGLGLAISRDLARAMDGDLFAENEPGYGTRFVLRLPRA